MEVVYNGGSMDVGWRLAVDGRMGGPFCDLDPQSLCKHLQFKLKALLMVIDPNSATTMLRL